MWSERLWKVIPLSGDLVSSSLVCFFLPDRIPRLLAGSLAALGVWIFETP